MVEIELSRNNYDEEGLNFKSEKNESLYFIPMRQLGAIDTSTTLLSKTYNFNVLAQIIRISKHDWADKTLLFNLMNLITKHRNIKDSNLISDTFIVVRDFYKIDIISEEYLVKNPRPDQNSTKYSEWNNNYISELESVSYTHLTLPTICSV